MIFGTIDGEIDIIPEARKLKVVKDLRAYDKTNERTYYKRAVKYVYYVFSPKSLYKNQLPDSRKARFCIDMIGKDHEFWKKIEAIREVRALISWYNENAKTVEERMIDAVDNDIQKYLEHLNSIEYVKSGKDGVPIQNFNEKMTAIKGAKELILYRKELRIIITGTKSKSTKKKFRTRLFEDG